MEKEEEVGADQCPNRPHWEMLDTAFLQLSFAIKLWHYLDTRKFDKKCFDISLTVLENFGRICLPDGEFNTFDDILGAAGNNISICFGIAANTLWEALREKNDYETRALDPNNFPEHMLASLSFILRCCFAHGPAAPKWKMDKKYRIVYCVGNKCVDLTHMDGQPFDYSDIGGFETLRLLRAEAELCGML